MTERTTRAGWSGGLPRLTLPELWACLAVLLPVLGALIASISTVDLAYHLRAGAIVLDSRSLPSPDTFTFTAAGLPWVDQQWGAQAAFAAIFRSGGWALLAVVRAGLVGLISWLVFRACRSAGSGTRAAAWLTLAGFGVGLVALGLRPQLLGMAFFAATVAILAGRDRRSRLIWAVPFIVLAWANVHGSFFLGPAALAIAWLEDALAGRPGARRLLAATLVSAGATLVTPYGPGVWAYATGLAANPTIRRLITEWQPTAPLSFVGAMFYGSIVGLAVVLALAVRRAGPGTSAAFLRRTWPTLLWLGGLVAIGAFAERGVAWWSIAAPVGLARLVGVATELRSGVATNVGSKIGADVGKPGEPAEPARTRPRVPPRSLVSTGIVAVLALAVVALLPVWRAGDPRYGPAGLLTDAPRGITEAVLADSPAGARIWNAQRWGSWLELTDPGATVAVDSRIELIPGAAWDDHLVVSAGAAGWSDILDRWGVTVVVASLTEQRGLIPQLRASSGWRVAYEDDLGVVFMRTAP